MISDSDSGAGRQTARGNAGAGASATCAGDGSITYAPSLNTRENAIERATQLRVQNLLRQLLCSGQTLHKRVDTIRVLRKTLREVHYQINWLTQIDLLETIERILSEEHETNGLFEGGNAGGGKKQQALTGTNNSSSDLDSSLPLDWRLINDCTQLLIEVIPKLDRPIDAQTLGQLFPIVVENLGHERSEVRRSSLLFLNMYLNERPKEFRRLMRVLIEYGLSNGRNERARRGAILSLPLLLNEQLVKNENLMPLIGCLCDQLIDNENEQLFYSLYLALQRLHQMLGDQKFGSYLSRCDPAASMLYKQAASRSNSLAGVGPTSQSPHHSMSKDASDDNEEQPSPQPHHTSSSSKQVKFEQQANNDPHLPTDSNNNIRREGVHDDQSSNLRSSEAPKTKEYESDNSCRDSDAYADSFLGDDPLTNGEGRGLINSYGDAPVDEATSSAINGPRNINDGDGHRTSSGTSTSNTTSATGSKLGRRTSLFDVAPEATGPNRGDDFFRPQSGSSSTVSSTCSSEANLVNPAHYMSRAALLGNPLVDYETIHHIDHSQVTSLAINDIGPVSNTPTMELGPNAQKDLKFGIFPKHLISTALNIHSNLRQSDRLDALQELMCIVRDSPVNHLAILMSYFDLFMEQFLSRLLPPMSGSSGAPIQQQSMAGDHHSSSILTGGFAGANTEGPPSTSQNYPPASDARIQLIAIDMIETIVIKTKVSTMHYVRPLVALLVRSLAARAPTVRQNAGRVIHKIMSVLPPQHCIDALFEHKHARNALIRAALVDRVTCAVLEYDRDEFNLTKLCYHILPMLADHNANVRLASLECIATLAHALGPERIGTLLTAAEAVQTGCDYDGLLDAINARLMRRSLPRSQPDAGIRYVLKPFVAYAQQKTRSPQGTTTTTTESPETLGADIKWVLEAPATHQHHHHVWHPHQHHSYADAPADQGDSQAHQHHDTNHLHRPGVYSPPPFDPSQRRRRSSLGLRQLMPHSSPSSEGSSTSEVNPADATTSAMLHRQHRQHQHQHHHHHHHHHPLHAHHVDDANRQQQRDEENDNHTADVNGSKADGDSDSTNTIAKKDISETSTGRNRRGSTIFNRDNAGANMVDRSGQSARHLSSDATHSDAHMPTSVRNRRHRSEADALAAAREQQQQPQPISKPPPVDNTSIRTQHQSRRDTDKQHREQQPYTSDHKRRSSSQDSISSTDTNKMLFQYYLGKFRQSLADNSLGTDPNVQPNTAQAYALNRQQSRFQQTSFENSNGDNYEESSNRQKQQRRLQPANTSSVNQDGDDERNLTATTKSHSEDDAGRCGSATTASESPVTVMEAVASQDSHRRESGGRKQHGPLETSGIADPVAAAATVEEQQCHQKHPLERRKSVSSSKHSRSIGDINDSAHLSAGYQQQHDNDTAEQHSGSDLSPKRDPQASPLSASSSMDSIAERPVPPTGRSSTTSASRLTRQESPNTSASGRSRLSDESGAGTAEESGHRHRRDPTSHEKWGSDQQEQRVTGDERPSRQVGSRRGTNELHQKRADLAQRRRASRSQPPQKSRHQVNDEVAQSSRDQGTHHRHLERSLTRQQLDSICGTHNGDEGYGRRAMSVSPLLSNTNVNIRHILENVAQVEGPFVDPQLALKVALDAIESQCWSTKVEGILAFIRLVTYHPQLLGGHLHEIVCRTCDETKNLRSTVARSAIFALGDYCAKLKRTIESDMDIIVQALLNKSTENTTFIRDDIRRSLAQMVDSMTHWRLANSLIHHGANHKNLHVRRMASQFIAAVVERMGAAKCLVGARDISAQVIPAAAKFAQDGSPQTRYYGRQILAKLMQHGAFERLLRRSLAPNLYRSTVGIIESVRRRGPGEPPADS